MKTKFEKGRSKGKEPIKGKEEKMQTLTLEWRLTLKEWDGSASYEFEYGEREVYITHHKNIVFVFLFFLFRAKERQLNWGCSK